MINERKNDNDGDSCDNNDPDHFKFLLHCYFWNNLQSCLQ